MKPDYPIESGIEKPEANKGGRPRGPKITELDVEIIARVNNNEVLKTVVEEVVKDRRTPENTREYKKDLIKHIELIMKLSNE